MRHYRHRVLLATALFGRPTAEANMTTLYIGNQASWKCLKTLYAILFTCMTTIGNKKELLGASSRVLIKSMLYKVPDCSL